MKLYIKRTKTGVDAVMDFNPQKATYTVLKGSRVSESIAYSEKFRGAKSIEKARDGIIVDGILTIDKCFKSASTAANFVTGNSTNGLTSWKDENGVTLKKIVSTEDDENE